MSKSLNPRARLVAILLGIAGVFLTPSPTQLVFIWFLIGIPSLLYTHMLKTHLRFLAFVVFPLSAMLFLIWGVIMGAAPGGLPHSSTRAGIEFAALITSRIIVLGTITQLGLVSLGADGLISFCAELGLPRDLRIMTVGATILVPEMKLRANQVFTARCARGLMNSRGLFDRCSQLPAMLRALVTWSLRSAVDRSEMWSHRRLLSRESGDKRSLGLRLPDFLAMAVPSVWVIWNLAAVTAR